MLTAHGLTHHIILHDVVTHWNSTYDMLDFTIIKYCPAIDTMTAAQDLGLCN